MQTSTFRPRNSLSASDNEAELAAPDSGEQSGFFSLARHFFAHNAAVNGLMIFAIVIGFFQGWMKLHVRGGWVTFAFDIPVMLALLITVTSIRRGRHLFPDCNMGKVLIALTAIGILYVVLPFGVPLLISLASFRAWCMIPLVFLVGYHATRTVRQIEVYLWLLSILGVIVSVYAAFFQTAEEVQELMKMDPELMFRLQTSFYADSSGHGVFRRFSTFVSSAAFGGMMAYCTTFAVARLAHPGCSWLERIWLIASSVIMCYGVVISGSRSSLITLFVGIGFSAWYRGGIMLALGAPLVGVASLGLGYLTIGASAFERFGTLLDSDVVGQRMNIVFEPAWYSLMEYPLGGGLGRSGHGVPMILYQSAREIEIRTIDGDLGRMVVDMGIVGLVVFAAMVIVGISDAFRWMIKLRGSPLGVVGLPAGSMFILAASQLVYGSPFLGIPGGVLLWFFLGSMRRLVEDYDKLVQVVGQEQADVASQFVSFITPHRLMPLFKQDQRQRNQGTRVRGLTTKSTQSVPTAGAPTNSGAMSSVAPGRIPSLMAGNPSWKAGAGPVATPGNLRKPDVTKRFLFRRPADSPDRRRPRP